MLLPLWIPIHKTIYTHLLRIYQDALQEVILRYHGYEHAGLLWRLLNN